MAGPQRGALWVGTLGVRVGCEHPLRGCAWTGPVASEPSTLGEVGEARTVLSTLQTQSGTKKDQSSVRKAPRHLVEVDPGKCSYLTFPQNGRKPGAEPMTLQPGGF